MVGQCEGIGCYAALDRTTLGDRPWTASFGPRVVLPRTGANTASRSAGKPCGDFLG